MYSVSSGFLTALAAPSMTMAVSATTSNGLTLSVDSGSVGMDSRRNVTRTCDLQLLPTATMSASELFDAVTAPGVEITVKRGLYVNGIVEWVTLGVFNADGADVSISVAGTVRWTGSDRSKKISRNRFIDPYQITSGSSLATAITNLLRSRWNSCPVDFSNVVDTVKTNIVFEAGESSDPWQCARDLMSDFGYDLNFNGDGVARAVTVADPATQASVYDFGSGIRSRLLDGARSSSLEKTYNGMVVSGEGTGTTAPPRFIAWDTDPASPTYYLGGYGQVPYFYSSPLLGTVNDCQKVATAALAKVKGRTLGLSWSAIVNPALEPFDLVTVTANGTTSQVVVDSLTVPLRAADSMSLVAREVRVS